MRDPSPASISGHRLFICSACLVESVCRVQRTVWEGGCSRSTQTLQYFSRAAFGWGGRQFSMRALGALFAVTAICCCGATSAVASSSSVASDTLVRSFLPSGSRPEVHVAEVSCSSRDGSRTCSCETKCHRTQDDCECEDD